MDKPARVLTDAEFSILRKYACVKCEHFGYCPSCRKLECSLSLPLSEVPCKYFIRNVGLGSEERARTKPSSHAEF